MDIRVMQYFVTVAKEESYEKKNDVIFCWLLVY